MWGENFGLAQIVANKFAFGGITKIFFMYFCISSVAYKYLSIKF